MAKDTSRQKLTDQTVVLVSRLREGESAVGALLNGLYRDALLRFCWGYMGSLEEAEDALQEVWYRVISAKEVPDKFRPWVYKIARNYCINARRKRARQRDANGLPAASQLLDSMTGHLTRLINDEKKAQLGEALRDLTDDQHEALRLRYVEDLSRAEIAAVLDISEALVKSRLFEGMKRLRDHSGLAEGGGE